MDKDSASSVPDDIMLYTVREVANILHLSVYSVRKFVKLRRLKAFCHLSKCNTKRIFITERDLRIFMYQYFLDDYWEGHKRPLMPKKI